MIYSVFGYKVFKENDIPFGYDNVDGSLVVNPVESEIVKYTFGMQLEPEKKADALPEEWVKYLEEKTEECKKIIDAEKMEVVEIPEWVRISEHTPIVDESIWKEVQGKLSEPQEENTGMQMEM